MPLLIKTKPALAAEGHEGNMNDKYSYVGIWIAVGVGMGAALGAAMHNMGVWVAVGAGIGVALGVAMSANTSTDGKAPKRPGDKG